MPFSNSLGYTLDDPTIEELQNGTFPELDEIITESIGIWFDENDVDIAPYLDENCFPLDFTFKFVGFDTHAMFEVTFENGEKVTYPVPLYYFDN